MYSELERIMSPGVVKYNELMTKYTTFQIGGPVDILIEPDSTDQLRQVLLWCQQNEMPFFIFGAASNILVLDKGIRGVGIRLGDRFKRCSVENQVVTAQSGILLAELSRIAAAHSLSGLEFAEGIPGTLGGAVVMNAGAYDHEMKEILIEASAINAAGDFFTLPAAKLELSYRHSVFQENGLIVVSARMQLTTGVQQNIIDKMQELAQTRASKQPLEMPSAGSVFKRPEGYYVGPMLEQLGLKGFQIGGAQVSAKHAGFIVNAGGATAADVIALIEEIKARACKEYGVDLHPEIRIVGER